MPAKQFKLTAELHLQLPKNIRPVVADIRRQLGDITVDVKLNVPSNAKTQLQALNTQVQALNKNTAATNSVLANQNKEVTKTTKSLQEARTEMEAFGFQSALAVRRFAAFSVATAGVISFVSALRSGVKESLVFNRELVRLSQVSGVSLNNLTNLTKEITRLATSLGVSSSDLIDVTSTLAQAGLSLKETRTVLEALAKSSLAPSFEDMKDTTEGVIAIMRQFNIQASDIESALGAINAVAAAYASESQDLITGIRTTGAVFASASKGVAEGTDALNQFISIFTSVRATTRESAESIATGLRTIFTRIQRPRTIEFLRQFGVELTDLEGKFVGPFEAVRRLNVGLKDLDTRDIRFAQIVEELGGYRQLGKTIPLIQQFATAQEAYQVAQQGTNSLTEAAITAQQALAIQIAKTREEFLALIRNITGSDIFRTLLTGVLGLTNAFIRLSDSLGPLVPLLLTVGGIRLFSSTLQFGRGVFSGIRRTGTGSTGQGLASLITGNRGYASGGLVPGYGNSDSVLANLTPGEYVIRKDAVRAIGADKLAGLNRLARGGTPKLFVQNQPSPSEPFIGGEYGGLFFRKESSGLPVGVLSVPISSLNPVAIQGVKSRFPRATKVHGSPFQFFISEAQGTKFDSISKSSFDLAVRNLLESTDGGLTGLSNVLGLSKQNILDTVKSQVGYEQLAGNLFEAYIGAMGRQITADRTRGLDFQLNPNNIGFFEPLFGPGIRGLIHADAKYTSDSSKRIDLIRKATNQYFTGNKTGLSLTSFGEIGISGVKSRAEAIVNRAGDTSKVPNIRGRAGGGSITDTVPALLTPGEFIIRKDSASKLGISALNRLNNADRLGYATGGLVGLQGGGTIDPNSVLAPQSIQRVNRIFDKYGVSLEDTLRGLRAVVQRMAKFGENIDVASSNVAKLITVEQKAITAVSASISPKVQGNLPFAAGSLPNQQLQLPFYKDLNQTGIVGSEASPSYGPLQPRKGLFGRARNVIGRLGNRFGVDREQFGARLRGFGATGAFLAAPYLQQALGTETPTAAGIGGGISGALGGAAIGSVFGPAGAGIGAAVGALNGSIKEIEAAKLAASMKELESSTKNLDKTYQDFIKGIATPQQLNQAQQEFNEITERSLNLQRQPTEQDIGQAGFFGNLSNIYNLGLRGSYLRLAGDIGTASSRQRAATEYGELINARRDESAQRAVTAYGERGVQAEDIFRRRGFEGLNLRRDVFGNVDRQALGQNFIQQNAALIRTLAYTGPNVLGNARFVEGATNKEEAQLTLGLQRLFDLSKNTKSFDDIANVLRKANTEVELLTQSFEKMSAGIQRATIENDKFNIVAENIINNIANTPAVSRFQSRQDIFNNIGAYSTREISTQLGSTGAALGVSPEVTERLSNTINSSKILQEQLPKFLLESFGPDGKTQIDESIVDAVSRFINSAVPQLPEEYKNQLLTNIESRTITSKQAGSQNFEQLAREEIGKMVESITKEGIQAAANMQKGLEEANKIYIDGINKFINIQLDADEKRSKLVGDDVRRRQNIATIFGRRIPIEESDRAINEQIKTLTGFEGATTDVSGIVESNKVISRRIKELQEEQQAAPAARQQALVDELAKNQIQLANNNKALNLVANSNERLVAIQNQILQQEEAKRGAGRTLAERIFGASPQELKQISRENLAFSTFESTGGQLPPEVLNNPKFRQDVLAGFRSRQTQIIDPQELDRFNAKFTNIFNKILGTINLPPSQAKENLLAGATSRFGPIETTPGQDAENIRRRIAEEEELLENRQRALSTTGGGLFSAGQRNVTRNIRASQARLRSLRGDLERLQGGPVGTSIEQGAEQQIRDITSNQGVAQRGLLGGIENIPQFLENLKTQVNTLQTSIGTTINKAFNLDMFQSAVTQLGTNADKLTKIPTQIKVEHAPIILNAHITGVDKLQSDIAQLVLPLIKEQIDVAVKKMIPPDARREQNA